MLLGEEPLERTWKRPGRTYAEMLIVIICRFWNQETSECPKTVQIVFSAVLVLSILLLQNALKCINLHIASLKYAEI